MKNTAEQVVRINIVGVGGGGSNAINRMMESDLPMVKYIAINTNDGAMKKSKAEVKIQIGKSLVKGFGAGADPKKGRRAAEEDAHEIEQVIGDCEMIFITAGMGGGTGTGAAPVVAEIAKKMGILTIAVVTKPFIFEGKKRMDNALAGISELEKAADAIIVIPNDNLRKVSDEKITLNNAFAIADDVLVQTVKNIVDVVQQTADINCDFADICSIVKDSGHMHTATGIASGEGRAEKVIAQIQESALLDSSVEGATGILLCISADGDADLEEIVGISSAISEKASPDVNLIFGMNFDDSMGDELKAVLLATKK